MSSPISMPVGRRSIIWAVLLGAAIFAIMVAFGSTASAHEVRSVDKYRVVIGFIVEPAFVGIKNGVDLRVSVEETEELVEGVQDTLQVEVTHVPTGVSKTMDLRTIFRDPGHYTADLIPTATGVYQMRIFGNIEGTDVDETFISRGAGGSFGDIEPTDELQFPESVPEVREIEAAARGATESAEAALNAADEADDSTLATIGVILGAIGIAFGVGSTAIALRQR